MPSHSDSAPPLVIRPAWRITLAVWNALFLRESLSRLFSARGAWFWLLAEPVFHVSYMMVLFTVISVRKIGGIDAAVWTVVGLLAYLTFRRTGLQAMNAIDANQALFAYRQVKPIDTVLTRGLLEGFLMIIVAAVLGVGMAALGHSMIPPDPLAVFEALLGLWLLGLGVGLVTSVLADLVPELGRLINFVLMPLYMVSGVLVPIALVPQPFRGWLVLNPIVHGLDAARLGFAPYYHAIPELSVGYLYSIALVTVFIGLALHRRFALRLGTQ